MKKEYLDVLDEKGNKTGKVKLRYEVHRDGDFHKTVHIWIINKNNDVLLHEGTIMTTEQFSFYSDEEHVLNRVPENIQIVGAEMESFALFHIANSFELEAACILTIVDSRFKKQFMSVEDREKSLNNMITLALESIL